MNWTELKDAPLSQVIAWAETQPWCQAMAECLQDPEWHAEGDVWTHTRRVLDELPRLAEWEALEPAERAALRFTALLHDVAKPLTSTVDPATGRVISPQHAVRGEHVARQVLRELECDLETREVIARMVRYHGRPMFLGERSEPTHEVVRLSWLVSNQLLYLFALADTRGRDTDSFSRPEENLHYWKLVAEENGCLDAPYPFSTDHARFVFFRQRAPNLHYLPHEDFACQVTMMAGLPGSGKDTWLANNRPELPVVSLDALRQQLGIAPTDAQGQVIQAAQEQCRGLLRAGRDFAFNATNTLRQTRHKWIELFSKYRARIELVYVEPPLPQILRQNRGRPDAVPEKVLRRLAERYEPPTRIESHQLLLVDGS